MHLLERYTGTQDAYLKDWTLNFKPDNLVSHILLVHNMRAKWMLSINAVFWSIATEWQIYFLMPFLLLPAWRRWGSAACIIVGLVVGLGIGVLSHILLPQYGALLGSRLWFAGLFAMGMTSAVVAAQFSGNDANALQRRRVLLIGVVCGATGMCLLSPLPQSDSNAGGWLFDVVTGATISCLLAWCICTEQDCPSESVMLIRVFKSRPIVALGTFSFSLYLIHWPVLYLVRTIAYVGRFPTKISLLFQVGVGLPTAIIAGCLFYQCIERPCLLWRVRLDARTRSTSDIVRPVAL